MASLIKTNPYLRDPKRRRRWIEENALDSAAFEGARGLPRCQEPRPSRARRSKARRKKAVRRPYSCK
ncbi:MAG: hypothetical protein FJ288_12830 [Planctomycetes bacterium]|nr:hypothetical protein [Planctomycetota bacterium]